MTTQEVIALAKEKLGKDITEQEALDYLSGKTPIPDEALELISGGVKCKLHVLAYNERAKCPICRRKIVGYENAQYGYLCEHCGIRFSKIQGTSRLELVKACNKCGNLTYFQVAENETLASVPCRICVI